MSSTRKVNKGGGFFNLFKRSSTKNNLRNLRKKFGHASNSYEQRVRRNKTYEKHANEAENAGNSNTARLYMRTQAKDDITAGLQNENLNKSFDDILNMIYSNLAEKSDEYKIIRQGFSNTKNKERCNVYFIVYNNKIEYKIRKCPNSNTIEIKSYHGRWKLGPFDPKLEEILDDVDKKYKNKA